MLGFFDNKFSLITNVAGGALAALTNMQVRTLIVFLAIAYPLVAYPSGPPLSACDNLLPNHGVDPQDGESPFQILTSATSIQSGETITVQVQAEAGRFFKGFFLVAHSTDGSRFVGDYFYDSEEVSDVNIRNCGNGRFNAVGHANAVLKEKISFEWNAPADFEGSIQFQLVSRALSIVFLSEKP